MKKTIEQARKYAAQCDWEMSKHALDEDYGFASHITHEYKLAYVKHHEAMALEIEAGKQDHIFAIWQRMEYFMTGECVPFLPK